MLHILLEITMPIISILRPPHPGIYQVATLIEPQLLSFENAWNYRFYNIRYSIVNRVELNKHSRLIK